MLTKQVPGLIIDSPYQGWQVVTGDIPMIWQGIEQQKIWLRVSQDELPVKETLEIVTKQIASDNETHADPPES